MNDFTKEELKDIHYALTEYGNFESAPVETLGEKIQSMIDNYCDKVGWVHRQKPVEDNGKWYGNPWPAASSVLFEDVNGVQCLAKKVSKTDYEFPLNHKIDVYRLCKYKEIEEKDE